MNSYKYRCIQLLCSNVTWWIICIFDSSISHRLHCSLDVLKLFLLMTKLLNRLIQTINRYNHDKYLCSRQHLYMAKIFSSAFVWIGNLKIIMSEIFLSFMTRISSLKLFHWLKTVCIDG
jgi:hypothetical protein